MDGTFGDDELTQTATQVPNSSLQRWCMQLCMDRWWHVTRATFVRMCRDVENVSHVGMQIGVHADE